MDFKSLLLILSISSLLISSNAVPSFRVFQLNQFPPSGAPVKAPELTASAFSLNSLVSEAGKVAKFINPEILKFCVDTENPALCADTISKFLNGPFDPIRALEIEVDATFKQAKNVAETIVKLLKNPSTNKKALDALDICNSQYGDMVDAIKEAVELIQQQNVVDAYYKFNSVISYHSSCDDAFTESPGVEMPFSKDSQTLFELGGNVLAMMNGIVNHHRV